MTEIPAKTAPTPEQARETAGCPLSRAARERAQAASGAFPASHRVYIPGSRPDLQVAMREIIQDPTPTTGEPQENPPLRVYDTGGPYTDPDAELNPASGIPPIRAGWVAERGTRPLTQRGYARAGMLTPEMEYVALREGVSRHTSATRSPGAVRSSQPATATLRPSRWRSGGASRSRSMPTSATPL